MPEFACVGQTPYTLPKVDDPKHRNKAEAMEAEIAGHVSADHLGGDTPQNLSAWSVIQWDRPCSKEFRSGIALAA